jgi:cytochrome oxidase Cu insertion factor (SCO1/SenC/PrrC family)
MEHISIRPAVLGAVAWLLAGLPAGGAAVVPGDPAPDFTLQDVQGTSHTLGALRGKLVLLAFNGYG